LTDGDVLEAARAAIVVPPGAGAQGKTATKGAVGKSKCPVAAVGTVTRPSGAVARRRKGGKATKKKKKAAKATKTAAKATRGGGGAGGGGGGYGSGVGSAWQGDRKRPLAMYANAVKSRAYGKARTQALNEGKSKEEAKLIAQTAYRTCIVPPL
jgi:hypothetical protein